MRGTHATSATSAPRATPPTSATPARPRSPPRPRRRRRRARVAASPPRRAGSRWRQHVVGIVIRLVVDRRLAASQREPQAYEQRQHRHRRSRSTPSAAASTSASPRTSPTAVARASRWRSRRPGSSHRCSEPSTLRLPARVVALAEHEPERRALPCARHLQLDLRAALARDLHRRRAPAAPTTTASATPAASRPRRAASSRRPRPTPAPASRRRCRTACPAWCAGRGRPCSSVIGRTSPPNSIEQYWKSSARPATASAVDPESSPGRPCAVDRQSARPCSRYRAAPASAPAARPGIPTSAMRDRHHLRLLVGVAERLDRPHAGHRDLHVAAGERAGTTPAPPPGRRRPSRR